MVADKISVLVVTHRSELMSSSRTMTDGGRVSMVRKDIPLGVVSVILLLVSKYVASLTNFNNSVSLHHSNGVKKVSVKLVFRPLYHCTYRDMYGTSTCIRICLIPVCILNV